MLREGGLDSRWEVLRAVGVGGGDLEALLEKPRRPEGREPP